MGNYVMISPLAPVTCAHGKKGVRRVYRAAMPKIHCNDSLFSCISFGLLSQVFGNGLHHSLVQLSIATENKKKRTKEFNQEVPVELRNSRVFQQWMWQDGKTGLGAVVRIRNASCHFHMAWCIS
jgi:hypothetical protein